RRDRGLDRHERGRAARDHGAAAGAAGHRGTQAAPRDAPRPHGARARGAGLMRALLILTGVIIAAGAVAWFGFGDEARTVTGDKVARLIALGAILTLLASGLLGSGIGLGRGVRNLAIWAAIVVALIAGYQNRYELQDI